MPRLQICILRSPNFSPRFIFSSSMEIYQATYIPKLRLFRPMLFQQISHHHLYFISVLLAKLFLSPCLLPFSSSIFHKHVEKGNKLCSSSDSNIQRQHLGQGKDRLFTRPIPHIILSQFNIKTPKHSCQYKVHLRPCQTIAKDYSISPVSSS